MPPPPGPGSVDTRTALSIEVAVPVAFIVILVFLLISPTFITVLVCVKCRKTSESSMERMRVEEGYERKSTCERQHYIQLPIISGSTTYAHPYLHACIW